MNIVILIFVSVVIFFLLQANKEYKQADKNINSLILEAANATSNGDYNKAIQLLTSALHQNTMYHNVWNSRGENYMKLKMYEQALADFNKSISINPDRNINYTAYTNKEKVDKIIYNKIQALSVRDLILHANKNNERIIISNIQPCYLNYYEKQEISSTPQIILIDFKNRYVDFSDNSMHLDLYNAQLHMFGFETRMYIVNVLFDDEIVSINLNRNQVDNPKMAFVFSTLVIGTNYILTLDVFTKNYMNFPYNNNWIIRTEKQ